MNLILRTLEPFKTKISIFGYKFFLPTRLFSTYMFINFHENIPPTRLFGLHVYSVPRSTLKHRLAITIQGFFFCLTFKEVIAARQDWMHLRSKKIFIMEMIQDYCHVKCHYHHKYRSWGEAEKQRKLFYSKNRSLG